MLDHATYLCLVLCTIAEPVFFKKCSQLFGCSKKKKKVMSRSNTSSPMKKSEPFLSKANTTYERGLLNQSKRFGQDGDSDEEKSVSMVF